MIPIDTIVSIKSGDEYGGKYTGKLGIIKRKRHFGPLCVHLYFA